MKGDSGGQRKVRVLCLNCQHGRQPELQAFLAQVTHNEEYDFILFQEMNRTVEEIASRFKNYHLVRTPSVPEESAKGHQSVLYHHSYTLQEAEWVSFRDFFFWTSAASYGMTLARFMRGKNAYVLSSLHLHSGLLVKTRRKEIRFIKSHIHRFVKKTRNATVIFGGDFNDGAPWEKKTAPAVFGPEYVDVTVPVKHTLNSRYSEPAGNGINEISWLLAKMGIGLSIKVDHVYTDKHTAKTRTVSCRALLTRVSDHSPIEVVIE